MQIDAARAGVFTAVSTGLAVTGHHLASGHSVSWRAVLLAAGVLFVVAVPSVSSLRSLPAVIAATGAVQAALHLWLAQAPEHSAHAAHAMAGHGAGDGDRPHGSWHAGHHGLSMTGAHILAAVLVAWCLQRADAACRAVVERLGDVLVDWFVRAAPGRLPLDFPRTAQPVRARAQSPPGSAQVLAHVVVRRGPPAADFTLAS